LISRRGFGSIAHLPPTTAAVAASPKLLDRVRWRLRVKHYSIRTEQAYVEWIRRFILFHCKRHPNEMGEREITQFLTHLAVQKHVAASTQNQAFAALLFLYQRVLERKLDFIDVGASWIRPGRGSLFCRSSRADCCARLGQAQRLHDIRKRFGNGRHFDRVVGAARCHLRFPFDSGICRTLDLASSI
jgi:hypothetical protein